MSRIPRWAEWWIERLLGDDRAVDVLGDLEELSAGRTRMGARWWVLGQVLRLTWRRVTRRDLKPSSPRARSAASLADDVRISFRAIRRSPGVSAAIVMTLALAIGATTALFTVADAVLFKALPFDAPDRLVVFWETEPPDMRRAATSPPNLVDFREGADGFEAFAGYAGERFTLTGDGPPTQVLGVRVTEDFFAALRASPLRGRVFDAADEADRKTVVLSHGFWAARLGLDPNVLERTITLDDEPHQVVGVMPETFRFPDDDEVALWVPLAPYPWERIRWTRTTSVIARLGADTSLETARAQLSAVAASLGERFPETNGGWGVEIAPVRELLGDQRALTVLLGTVGLVLLIACANVANLLLVRSTERGQELGIRAALGASRVRLIRLLMMESATLTILGGAAGLGLAAVGVRVLLALEPGTLPRWNPVALDARALLFTLGVAVLVALLAGTAPALRASRQGLAAAGGQGTQRAISDRSGSRSRALLSSFEVALAIVLTTGAALLVTSLLRLRAEEPGFEPDGVLTATLELPDRYEYGSGRIEAAYDDILLRARALPGVTGAGWVTALPMSRVGTDYDIEFFRVERPDLTPVEAPPRADFRVVSEGYLESIGVPVVTGRALEPADGDAGVANILVNRTLVDRYFPGEDPLGQQIRLYQTDGQAYRVVGVVGNVRHRGLDDESRPEIYVHFRQMAHNGMTLALRTQGDPTEWATPLAAVVREVDSDLPLLEVRAMSSLLDETLAERRFSTALLLAFAGLGLAIALIGVQGTLSYAVSRRTREIGVRMALGAERARVVRQVLGGGARVIVLGLVVGILAAAALSRTLESMLYGVEPGDPRTLTVVAALVAVVALAACLHPALRASRVDPVEALREG